MARKLIVEILGDTSGLDRATRRSREEIGSLGGAVGKLRIGFATLAKSFIFIEVLDKALEGLHTTIHEGTAEIAERQTIQAQLNAVMKSTGDVANVSAKHVDTLALSLSNLSGIDDEVIKGGEATLLTFTNIRNYAGQGNKIFDRATLAATNFSAKTGKSMQQASLAIGRALQDPAKAATGLRRAQLVLTASEKQAIAVAIRHRDTLKAQQVILDALQKRYGGQAAALGKTLPGQINVLRARFKDLAGDIGTFLLPGLTAGVKGVTDFVRRLSEASGARAKLRVVFEGLRDLGKKLVAAVRSGIRAGIAAVERIDWGEVRAKLRIGLDRAEDAGRRLYQQAREAIRSGIEQLRRVDWKSEIDRAARVVGDALVEGLAGLRHYIDRVNWNQVGRAITVGIVAAIGAVVRFLARLPWAKIADQIGRLLVAALRGAWAIFMGISDELELLLERALGQALDALGRWLEAKGLEIALKIIHPFTLLPNRLGGGWAKDLQAKIQTSLDALKTPSAAAGKAAGDAFSESFSAAVADSPRNAAHAIATGRTRSGGAGAGEPSLPPAPTPGGVRRDRQRLVDLRNRIFDNLIARELDRAGDLPIPRQVARLKEIAAQIVARIAATKDVTRRLELEDRLRGVFRQIKGDRAQLSQAFLDALSFDVDKAGATKTLQDDLRALLRLEAGIRAQIKVAGRTLDLTRQLFEAQQRIADVRKQMREQRTAAREARQFRQLGFGPGGEDLVPGVNALKRSLARISDALKGTFLDTKHTSNLMKQIRKILGEGIGNVSKDVRAKIAEILSGFNDELKKNQVDVTRFHQVSTDRILAGLGLSPVERRRLSTRLATLGPGMTMPNATAQYSAAGAGGIIVQGDVHVHGVTKPKEIEHELTKRAKSRPHVRRGAR